GGEERRQIWEWAAGARRRRAASNGGVEAGARGDGKPAPAAVGPFGEAEIEARIAALAERTHGRHGIARHAEVAACVAAAPGENSAHRRRAGEAHPVDDLVQRAVAAHGPDQRRARGNPPAPPARGGRARGGPPP